MLSWNARRCGWLWLGVVMLSFGVAACGPQKTVPDDAYGNPERAFSDKPPVAGAPLPVSAPPADAKAALSRMVAAYRSLSSAHLDSHADVVVNLGQARTSHQETILEFVKQPARVGLYVRDTAMGTQVLQADGATMVHWEGVSNRYKRRSVTGSLADLCAAVDKEAVQLMSPLVFAQQTTAGLPPGVANVGLAAPTAVDGKPAQVVEGSLTPEFMGKYSERIFGTRLTPVKGRFSLWLDAGTGIVLRCATDLAWSGTIKDRDGKAVAKDPKISATEVTYRFVPNPKLPDDHFRFLPPKGASESAVERASEGRQPE